MAKRRHNKDLPRKTDPAEFGGGRRRGYYTLAEIMSVLCSVAGCGRAGYATWGGCADDNVQRPFCAEHDIALNWQVLVWTGDPDREEKITRYANRVEAQLLERAGRRLDDTALPFLTRDEAEVA